MTGTSAGRSRVRAVVGVSVALALLSALAGAAPALAEGSTWWHLNATAAPTLLPRHGEAQLVVTATNIGDGVVDAERQPVVLTDELPPDVRPVAITTALENTCHIDGQTVTCIDSENNVAPYGQLMQDPLDIVVEMEDPSEPLSNVVKIEGGETPFPSPLQKRLMLAGGQAEKTPFGVEPEGFEMTPESEEGQPATQAGSHPFQLSTQLDLNERLEPTEKENFPGAGHKPGEPGGAWPSAPALPHVLRFKLPPGLVGDPSAVPPCTSSEFHQLEHGANRCPGDTATGVVGVTAFDASVLGLFHKAVPLFNLEPGPGEPARFGFVFEDVPITLKTAVPSGGDYGVEVTVEDVSQAVALLSSEVTFWGVPGDPRHNRSRGWGCLDERELLENGDLQARCEPPTETVPKAFLDLPTSCQGAPEASVSGESWGAGIALPPVAAGAR